MLLEITKLNPGKIDILSLSQTKLTRNSTGLLIKIYYFKEPILVLILVTLLKQRVQIPKLVRFFFLFSWWEESATMTGRKTWEDPGSPACPPFSLFCFKFSRLPMQFLCISTTPKHSQFLPLTPWICQNSYLNPGWQFSVNIHVST